MIFKSVRLSENPTAMTVNTLLLTAVVQLTRKHGNYSQY